MKLIKKIIYSLISNGTYVGSKKDTKKLLSKGYINEKSEFTDKFYRLGITYMLFIELDTKIRIGQQISNINSEKDYFYISDKDFFFKLLKIRDTHYLVNYSV